jgi:hypothetical protein
MPGRPPGRTNSDRVAATLVLLGALVMAVLAWRARDRAALVPAAALLGVALLLSVVGVAGGASRTLPVVLANLLGAWVMLVSFVLLAGTPGGERRGGLTWAMLLLLACQASAGTWASVDAAADCFGLSGCGGATALHRASGVLLALGLLVHGLWVGWTPGRRAGLALGLTAGLLLWAGLRSAAAGGSLARPGLTVLHNALAALAVVLLAWSAARRRAPGVTAEAG